MLVNALSSANFCVSLFSNYPDIIRVAAYVAFFTLFLIILTLSGIFYHRVSRGRMLRLSALAEGEILDELNDRLFLYDSVTEIPESEMNAIVFRLNFLKNRNAVFRQSMTDLLVYFQTNLTGAVDNIMSSAFSRLGLRESTLDKLRSSSWFHKTEGLTEVQEMQDGHSLPEVYKLIKNRNPDVRIAAYAVLLKMKTKNCFDFLSKEKEELSEWHQIMLEDAAITTENPNIPEFKHYLTSTNQSILVISIRLIVAYHQFNAIPKLFSMLDNENEHIRHQIIIALGELRAQVIEDRLIERYPAETAKNKLAILNAIGQIGSGMSADFLKDQFLEAEDFAVMEAAASAIFAHSRELAEGILLSFTGLRKDHQAMLSNFE